MHARFRIALALAIVAAGAALAAPAGAAIFKQDFTGCTTMTVSGRTIACNDGTTIAIDAAVTPGCPQFALGRQGADYTLVCATPNATGLWWREVDNGRGTWISHQGDTIFAVDYAYDGAGLPRWRTLIATKREDGVFLGDVQSTTGPPFTADPFDPKAVVATTIGAGFVTIDDAQHLRINAGDGELRPLVRQQFGPLPSCAFGLNADLATATNGTDLWWNPAEPGWGVNLAHEGDKIFLAWFTYGFDGTPLWLVATTDRTGPGAYAGDLYVASGPAGAGMRATLVGSAKLAFTDGNHATFTTTAQLPGMAAAATQAKAITRQVFVAPGADCV